MIGKEININECNKTLIPTEDASSIVILNKQVGDYLVGALVEHKHVAVYPPHYYTNQHLYLTSDLKINEGDYFLDPYDLTRLCKSYGDDTSSVMIEMGMRVEFTNDKDGIDGGVREIPQSFMEAYIEMYNSHEHIWMKQEPMFGISDWKCVDCGKMRYHEKPINTKETDIENVIHKLKECFFPQNMECDGVTCQGCWKDIVRQAIKMLELIEDKNK